MNFNVKERDRRFAAVRENMKREGLDFLILFGATGVGGQWNGNFTYLSNYCLFFSTGILLFPFEGAPALFVPGENQYIDAKRVSWVEDIRLSAHPAADCADALDALAGKPSRIGISSTEALPVDAHRAIESRLAAHEFVDGTPAVFSAREKKSAAEREIALRGAQVADKGWSRALEVLKPGVSELTLMAEMEKVMTAEGADGYFNMLGAGRPEGEADAFRGFVVPPTPRTFQKGDLVLLEITPRVGGYWNQIVRLVSLGEPPEEIKKAHEACLHAKRMALENMKPGRGFADVARAIAGGLEKHGYSMKGVGSAHTTGLDLSESMMNLESDRKVEPGLLVTVHPMIATGEWRQLFVGETYFVDDEGPKLLNQCEEEMVIL